MRPAPQTSQIMTEEVKADSIFHLEMDMFAISSFAKIEEMASEMILPRCWAPLFVSFNCVFSSHSLTQFFTHLSAYGTLNPAYIYGSSPRIILLEADVSFLI